MAAEEFLAEAFSLLKLNPRIVFVSAIPLLVIAYGSDFIEQVMRTIRAGRYHPDRRQRHVTLRADHTTTPARADPRHLERRATNRVFGDKMTLGVLAAQLGLVWVPIKPDPLPIPSSLLFGQGGALSFTFLLWLLQLRLVWSIGRDRRALFAPFTVNAIGLGTGLMLCYVVIRGLTVLDRSTP